MLNDLFTVTTMRMLNNNKGSLIVILVIAMTLIAVLGASFVSIVSTKQEGFTLLLNAQKANMVARGGVEWAIRFASYGEDTNNNSIFFSNPTLTFTKNIVYGVPAEGAFSTNYDYGTGILTVNGTYQGVTETITLSNFRQYLSPITLYADASIADASRKPSYRSTNRRFLDVPVMVNDANITVSQINLLTNYNGMILRYIDDPAGLRIFDYLDSYNNPLSNYPNCNYWSTNTPCHYEDWVWDSGWSWKSTGLLLKSSPNVTELKPPDLIANTLGFSANNYTFIFRDPTLSPAPLHTIVFNPTTIRSEIHFRP